MTAPLAEPFAEPVGGRAAGSASIRTVTSALAVVERHPLVRRWDDLPLRTKGIAVIAIPLIPLFVSAALFTGAARNARSANDWVTRTLEVKSQIATTLSLMVDAETGARGFLLTHDLEALRSFEHARATVASALQRLDALVKGNPIQVKHVQTVRALESARPLPQLIAAARADPDGPPPIEGLRASRSALDGLRDELTAMQGVEDAVLARRSNDVRRRLALFGGGAAAFGLLGGVLAVMAFTAGVVRRVDRVRDDAVRLAHGDDLEPIVEARDEVGVLHRGLRDAARLLRTREAEVREHVRTFDQFFSLSLDLMAIADANGRFTRVNPAWQRTLGWTPLEMTSTSYLEYVHPDDRAATIAEASKLARGVVTVSFDNRYRAKDGIYRWLNWSSVADAESGRVYAIARDVTEQKRAASELHDRAAELAAVNQELEAFSYSVSHDLRAPLRHVTGFASLLKRSAGDRLAETEQRQLQTIVDAAGRMGRLIDDLLAFSRMGRSALDKQRIDLDTLVQNALHDVPLFGPGRPIAWTIHPLPDVDGDPAMLRQVFVNLLANAAKYSSGETAPAIEVGTIPGDAGEIVVFVRDNGVGFDMQYAHKLFGVFQRLHSTDDFEGTGIGLANVRRIVHRHGGRVWAESAVGRGATFFIALPAAGGGADDR